MTIPKDTRQAGHETADANLDDIVVRFEQAWRRGETPEIDDVLPADDAARGRLLIELLHVELRHRIRRGEQARVEQFVARHPSVASDKEQVLGLIGAECELRRRSEPELDVREYDARFPQYRDELEAFLQAVPPRPEVEQPLRLTCPHCLNPLQVNARPGQEVVCESCGDAFRVETDSTLSWRGERLPKMGKFELLEVAGSGAFGTVYRARDTELERVVAVKIPRAGRLADKVDEERFVREARNAAQLHHPGIVPVHEVGRSGSFPFIVSEYVHGMTLADFMKSQRFGVREAVEIVIEAAEALQHAHDHGVVHRDLKPSNIMLERRDSAQRETLVEGIADALSGGSRAGRGGWLEFRPRLMDFGLARRDDAEVTVTVEGQVLGTPAYMSPEQARGEGHDVDGRSDVYSLGVVLYELLAGELPFRGNVRMLLQQVLHNEPPSLRRFNDRIPRDLDTICMKCLRKEPAQRYPSAAALADDLSRYLQDLPIAARPAGLVDRTWRWCRRKPALAAMAASLLIVVLTGFALVTWQWRRAEGALEQARTNSARLLDASDEMLALFDQWLTRMPEEQPVRQQLLRRALVVYEQFLREQPDDPRARRDVATARRRVADIRRMLGQYELAAEQYEQAIRDFRRIAQLSPDDRELQRQLADSYNWMGESLRQGSRAGQAEAAYGEAARIQGDLVSSDPENPRYGGDLARSHYNLGLLLAEAGRNEEASDRYAQAVSLLDKLMKSNPDDVALRREAGRCRVNMGNLLAETGDHSAAHSRFLEAIELLETLVRQSPHEPEITFELATVEMNRANLLYGDAYRRTLELGVADPATEAEKAYRSAIDRLSRLSEEYASVPKYRIRLANCHNGLGSLLIFAARPGDADQVLRSAAATCRALVDRYPDIDEARNVTGLVLYHQAKLARQGDDASRAAELLREAVEHQTRALAGNPDNESYKTSLYAHHGLLATVLLDLGDHAEAARQAERLLPLSPQATWRAARLTARCASAASRDQELDDRQREETARQYADQAVRYLRAAVARELCDADDLERSEEFSALDDHEEYRRLRQELQR